MVDFPAVPFNAVLSRLPGRAQVLAAADRLPRGRDAVSPFVAGEGVGEAVDAVAEVVAAGMTATVQYLGNPEVTGLARLADVQVVEALANEDLAEGNDVLVDLPALGLGTASRTAVRADLAALCAAAGEVGLTVTIGGVGHELVESALAVHAALVGEFPDLGMTLPANLHRSEGDCLDLAERRSRVRLIRRETDEPADVALSKSHEIDMAYVRCLRLLLVQGARTTVATHDPTLLEIAEALGTRAGLTPEQFGYQFRRGVASEMAAELAATGAAVSIVVPFGPSWAPYVADRIALRPAAVTAALRAAIVGGGR